MEKQKVLKEVFDFSEWAGHGKGPFAPGHFMGPRAGLVCSRWPASPPVTTAKDQ